MSSPAEELLANLELIKKHPPERRQLNKRYVVLYSCCCCCCCCLHTVGGAIGAACGGDFRADESESDGKRYPSSQTLYWTSFLIIIPLAILLWSLWGPSGQAAIQVGLSIILLGPLWLLAGSVVMAIRLALRRDLPSKSEYWRQLRRITFGSIWGSLAGVAIMVAIFVLLTGAL